MKHRMKKMKQKGLMKEQVQEAEKEDESGASKAEVSGVRSVRKEDTDSEEIVGFNRSINSTHSSGCA